MVLGHYKALIDCCCIFYSEVGIDVLRLFLFLLLLLFFSWRDVAGKKWDSLHLSARFVRVDAASGLAPLAGVNEMVMRPPPPPESAVFIRPNRLVVLCHGANYATSSAHAASVPEGLGGGISTLQTILKFDS